MDRNPFFPSISRDLPTMIHISLADGIWLELRLFQTESFDFQGHPGIWKTAGFCFYLNGQLGVMVITQMFD